jgi:non-ribosomal peptide synthetase component F
MYIYFGHSVEWMLYIGKNLRLLACHSLPLSLSLLFFVTPTSMGMKNGGVCHGISRLKHQDSKTIVEIIYIYINPLLSI